MIVAQIVVFIVISPFPQFNHVKIVISPSKFWHLVKKVNLGQNALFVAFGHKHGRQKGLLELTKCAVSGLKRQFDKWHLFRAPTPPPKKKVYPIKSPW